MQGTLILRIWPYGPAQFYILYCFCNFLHFGLCGLLAVWVSGVSKPQFKSHQPRGNLSKLLPATAKMHNYWSLPHQWDGNFSLPLRGKGNHEEDRHLPPQNPTSKLLLLRAVPKSFLPLRDSFRPVCTTLHAIMATLMFALSEDEGK